jgi:ribosomal protein S18 acetylase RimI-like enzyme
MPEAVRVEGSKADGGGFTIRAATSADIPAVMRLDEINTGLAKPEYWGATFARYHGRSDRFFLVAVEGGRLDGFIVGEIRAWEFGSPPCGWIIALGVEPGVRLQKVGSQLFEAMCALLRDCGVDKVRTMLARDDDLNMAFFRSQGMWGGPFLQLEKPLD